LTWFQAGLKHPRNTIPNPRSKITGFEITGFEITGFKITGCASPPRHQDADDLNTQCRGGGNCLITRVDGSSSL